MKIYYSTLTKNIYQPKDVANMLGCSVRTIQYYCNNNLLKSYRNAKNRRLIDKQDLINFLKSLDLLMDDCQNDKSDIIYARVSTHKQAKSGNLDRQIEKISSFAITQNPINLKIYKEIDSGLNDNRPKLLEIINLILQNKINRIFIMYKDRLTRFGFNYLQTICNAHNTQIIIVSSEENEKSLQEELAEDIINIIHSFSGKLYGMRKSIKRSLEQEFKDN